MNRIQHHREEHPDIVGPLTTDDLEPMAGTVGLAVQETSVSVSCHALFVPMHYEPNYSYPVIVWLHGPAATESQIKQVMPLVSMRNFVAIAPRGTVTDDEDAGRGGYGWRQTEDHILLAEQRVANCLELVRQRFHIAPSRVFLAGYGDGGTMAVRVALNDPTRFAGVASLGGAFPSGRCPLRHLDEARRLPIMLITGRNSLAYPQARVTNDLRLLHSAGICLTLRQYPCGDDLTDGMLSDMNRWLMDLVCPSDSSSST